MTGDVLVIHEDLFAQTMSELRSRSNGWRESAAIWAGRVEGSVWKAEIVRFHHQLCDDSGAPLSIELTEEAKFKLYEELATMELRLVALIHTHPEDWVELSEVDRENQICSRLGFWSIVAPWYGRLPWEIRRFGVHRRGEDGWYQLTSAEAENQVILRRE